jgi:hypothetical protein
MVKTDVTAWLSIEIERTSMRVILRAGHDRGAHEPAQEVDEGGMPVQRENRLGLLDRGVVAHAPAFLVPGDIVPMDIHSKLFRLG